MVTCISAAIAAVLVFGTTARATEIGTESPDPTTAGSPPPAASGERPATEAPGAGSTAADAVPGRVATTAAAPGEAARSESIAVVNQLQEALLGLLRDAERLGYEGRLERISPTVDQTFDLPFMAEKVVGRYWRTLTPEQQARWGETFGGMTKANYAGRFDRDTGQGFEILGEDPAANKTVMVRTRLLDPQGEDVDLTYRLREVGGRWRIVDIYLKGTVSELALRRSEYSSVLKRDGFDALVLSVNEMVNDLAAGNDAP